MGKILKVATFNIASGHYFGNYAQDKQPIYDLTKISEFINTFGADVITLNEVISECEDERRNNQPQKIAERCGFPVHTFAQGVQFPWGNNLGNALLGKYPIINMKTVPVLAPTEQERREGENKWYEDRVILCCELDVGTRIRYITTHFGLNKQEKERMLAALVALLDESDMPTVLSGDFNETPHSEILQPIYDRLTSAADVVGDTRFTCEAYDPQWTLDYIFVSKHFEVLSYDVVEKVVSDHYPCLAQIHLK